MNTITINSKRSTSILGDTRWLTSAWHGLVAEVSAFVSVIFSSRRMLADIERMAALHRAAAALDHTDPARAAQLRERAARICL